MPVRIYEIAKKLGLDPKEVLSKAKELGIAAARVPSSSLDKITAEYLETHLGSATLAAPILVVSTPPSLPISEVAKDVGLPIDELKVVMKEFNIPSGPSPNFINKDTAQELLQLVKGGGVTEKRLEELEKGGRILSLRGFSFREEWVSRISRCKHIQELNLSSTGLLDVPEAFADLKSLSVVSFSANKLSKLPRWLSDLPKLNGPASKKRME